MAAQGGALADRVGSTGFVQLTADSFNRLTPRQQALAYWLSQASIDTDPIIYDQLSRFGLRQKRLLEAIVTHPRGVPPDAMKKILDFTKLFWANKGNHNELTSQKFLPECTFEEFKKAAGPGTGRGGRCVEGLPVRPGFRADDHGQESAAAARHSAGEFQ